jgi:Fe-S-cluster containining protein
MNHTFKCRYCGHCCLNLVDAFNGCVSDADLERWRRLGRTDLLARVKTLDLGPGNQLHTAWLDPETGDDVERCPWLLDRIERQGYLCGIDGIKPDHCRDYPEHLQHAEATGCHGYRDDRSPDSTQNRQMGKE